MLRFGSRRGVVFLYLPSKHTDVLVPMVVLRARLLLSTVPPWCMCPPLMMSPRAVYVLSSLGRGCCIDDSLVHVYSGSNPRLGFFRSSAQERTDSIAILCSSRGTPSRVDRSTSRCLPPLRSRIHAQPSNFVFFPGTRFHYCCSLHTHLHVFVLMFRFSSYP